MQLYKQLMIDETMQHSISTSMRQAFAEAVVQPSMYINGIAVFIALEFF